MGNRKKMGKIEGHQQQGQKNPSQLSLEGAVLAAETDQITDVIDAVAAATAAAAASASVTRAAIAVAASSSSTAVEATTAASTGAVVLETATAGVTTAQAVMNDVPDGFSDQGTKRIHKENDERQVGTLSKDVEIAVNEGSNVSRDESDGDPFIKTFGTEDMNKGDVVQTTDVSGDSVGTAHLDQYSLDVKCQRQENELGDNQALQQPQLQNAKQQQPQQQQHRNQQHQLHHPHTQQQKPNQNHHQQQQQLQQQQHHLSQFLQTTTNNTPTLSINRPQQQQQQGLISLPAIPAPCYVHQQTSGSTVQTMGVDFLQQANQQQLFSITNPAHQVIGQIPSIHFPAIASNQHQQNIIVPPSHNTPGVQPQPTTAPSLPSAPFKNIEQQNLLCQGLNQHQQHQQNIMQQIEWQIQLQKNHIRQQQQQQQQQQQLQNLRQNLQQQQQQLIQLQNSGMFYQHQLKQRQNQQQQHHQNNGHHNHPHHQHHQQQHLNMLQLRQHQFPPQNSKVDLLCSSLDAPIEKNNDVFRGNQKMHIAPHFHVQQQEQQQHQHSHLQSLQLQPPQQQKKKHKQEHQHIDQQQSSSVSMFESQQTTTGSTDGTHSVNASCTTSTTTVIGAAAATAATATTTSSNTTTVNQGVNLYVKHLDDDVDDSALKKMFSRFGEVVSAKVMMEGQMSRGFGFVCFARAEDAARATRDIRRKSDDLSSMKNLYVAPAQRKEERQAIFRERLRSFMEDTPPGAASQDHETKKFVKPPTVKERTSTLASEGPPTQAIPNSSEVSFDRPAGSHPMVPNGANAISTNTFLHNSKTKNIPSLQNSDGKNQCAQLNQEENVRRIPVNSSFSLLPNNRFDNIESRQHRPIKNIFDLDNFSLEKLNMPLLQTAAQTCPKVQKNSMYSSTVSLGNAKESQAEPIPQWFYGADEEDGGFGNDVITLYQRDELLGKNLDSDCFASATAMDNMNNEYPRWLKLPDYFDFPDESNQEHDSYLCQSDAGPEVIEQIKAGNHEMIEVNNADDIQLHTDPIESWSGNLHIWNCKLITKEDNQILKENDGDEEEEEVGALLENKEDCIGTLDDCNRLVKACISCCTDTDSCISGDEDIDQEYKESNSILDTKCNRSDYFRSSQNVQNNNSIIDDDASCPMSPLSKWTKSRKRCLSSDERIPAAAETRIYDMTNQPNTNTNAPTHCKIIVTPTTNTNKIRVLDLPVVVAPSRKDTKRNRKRKRTTTSLAGDVEDVVSPKRIRTQENNERPVVHNNCKRPRLC